MAAAKPADGQLASLAELLAQDDALGQIYQAINAPALERAYRATSLQRRKFTADEIPAVTQLFTPKWVVEFLLHNTLGRLWRQMHPDTRLKWKWAVDVAAMQIPACPAIELRICDPACGTMNFGLVAIDMLRAIYREESERAGSPGWTAAGCSDPRQIDAAIVRRNLFGVDIDPLAVNLARRSLQIKIGRKLQPRDHNLRVADALFDAQPLGQFDVVVTNPPYLSARNLPDAIVQRMKRKFPTAWRDAYACFIVQSLAMLRPGGRAGILSMHSFMFTSAFERLRRQLAQIATVEAVAHFGPGLFDVGNPGTLQTAAMVLQRGTETGQPHFQCPSPSRYSGRGPRVRVALRASKTALTPSLCRGIGRGSKRAVFFRLVDEDDKAGALQEALRGSARRFSLSQAQLSAFPRAAWMYWVSPAHRRALRELPKLGRIAPPRQGLATTDNARFVRYWWEVEPPGFTGPRTKWFPYAKGGRFRRWYEAARHRVNWEDDGREIKDSIIRRYPYLNGQWQWVAKNSAWYGRAGITYSYLTSGSFSARLLEKGTLFDVAGSSLFPDDPAVLLGILNSWTAGQLLGAINPTVNFQVGDLRQLPVPARTPHELAQHVGRAVAIMRELESFDQTSTDFVRPAPWDGDDSTIMGLRRQLSRVESHIDRLVSDAYGVVEEDRQTDPIAPADRLEAARGWISWCLGIRLGRWGPAVAQNSWAMLRPLDADLAKDLRRLLAEHAGDEAASQIELAVGGLERFFARDFFLWHNRRYRGRPIFWCFAVSERIAAVSWLSADQPVMREMFRWLGAALPRGWKRRVDDGIAANLTPLAEWIADSELAASLRRLAFNRESGDGCAPLRSRIPRQAAWTASDH